MISTDRHLFRILLLFGALFAAACHATVEAPANQAPATPAAPVPPVVTPAAAPPAEPLPRELAYKYTPSLRRLWQSFTADGRYRLAQPSDMTFPTPPDSAGEPVTSSQPDSYVYIWGDLKYDKRTDDDHLAALVVDQKRPGPDRFSLVIFSPPKDRQDVYELHWLYRDRDLSKTRLSPASGEFYVESDTADGGRQACSVTWNRLQKQFVCQ